MSACTCDACQDGHPNCCTASTGAKLLDAATACVAMAGTPSFAGQFERVRALDFMREAELREERATADRVDMAERRASRNEYSRYLAAHIENQMDQTKSLRAILAEVTRRS